MEELIKSKDAEISKLLSETRELSYELKQCQADKEFVWSLWKRLQVSSPDLTQAISLIMTREKEKAEAKDRKVLEILQSKDEEIRQLQETAVTLKSDNYKMMETKSIAETQCNKTTSEYQQLQKEITKLQQSIKQTEQDDLDKINSYKQSLKEVEYQRDQLKDKVASFVTDLQGMRTRLQNSEDEQEQLSIQMKLLKNDIHDKDAVLHRLTKEKELLAIELEDVRTDYNRIKNKEDLTTEKTYSDIKAAYDQLQAHSRQQEQIIAQLQGLQTNTQKAVAEQEEKHRRENRKYEQQNQELEQLKKENEDQKNRIKIQDQALHTTERELKKSIEMATTRRREYNYGEMDELEEHISLQRREIDALQRRLREKNKRGGGDATSPYNDAAEQTFSPIVERGVKSARSRSLSPCGSSKQIASMQKKLKATETKLDDTKHLLELKKEEVREIQRAHNKRLERLKMLQEDYRALKSGTTDERLLSPRRRHKNRAKKIDPRNLRHENSETVWNDLARFKQENRVLMQERLTLEEEVDALRVQSAMDRAKIQDLNVCLKNEKAELIARLRPSGGSVEDRLNSTPKHEVKPTRRTTKNLERRLENAAEDNRLLKEDKDRLLDDNRNLKEDIKSLKREATETRQSGTKIRQENGELRRKLETLTYDNKQLSDEANTLRIEIQGLRKDNSGIRSENTSLRSENSDLRQDIADLKQELISLKVEIDHSLTGIGTERHSKKKSNLLQRPKSNIAKKHQKILNRSIHDMKDAFGDDFNGDELTDIASTTNMSEGVGLGEEGRSDASSLGQSIVKAARQLKCYNTDYDEDKDDDDTLTDEPSARIPLYSKATKRPSSLPRYRDGRMAGTLKQRVASLQAQCSSLRSAKENASRRVNEEREKNERLQSELSTCQNKIKNMKQTIQRFTREADVLQREREDLQQALDEARNKQPEPQIHSDADYKYLETKLKLANNEAQKMSDQVKDLKREIETKHEQANTEKEKLTRLERDVGMKRQLIDELRIKVKEHENRTKDDQTQNLNLQDRMKQIEEDLNHKKNHIESLRRQLQVSTKEKARYETMYNKSRGELEKRCEQLSSIQAGKLEAENATSQVQQEAEIQLHTLASRSEQALDKLKGRSEKAEERLIEFTTFVQNLTLQLFDLLCRQRETLLREKLAQADSKMKLSGSESKRAASSSMSHAQTVACNILNMSKSDFEDLMAPVDVSRRKSEQSQLEENSAVASKNDQSWKDKVQKIATENPPFAKSLCRLLWDKIQDAVKLTEERYKLQTDQLEEELLSKNKV